MKYIYFYFINMGEIIYNLSDDERKNIFDIINHQEGRIKKTRNYLIRNTRTDLLRTIITETKDRWLDAFFTITEKYNIKKHSKKANMLKMIVKIIISSTERKKYIENNKKNIIEVLNDDVEEKLKINEKIKKYLWCKDNKVFWIFKSYFLKRKEEWDTFIERTYYATKKVCEIYKKEINNDITTLFEDRARNNPYLEENENL